MAIALASIKMLSRDVVRQYGGGFDVIGVTTMGRDSDRVEILVTIGDCHKEPCRFIIDVSRADGDQFDREFRSKFTDALVRHAR